MDVRLPFLPLFVDRVVIFSSIVLQFDLVPMLAFHLLPLLLPFLVGHVSLVCLCSWSLMLLQIPLFFDWPTVFLLDPLSFMPGSRSSNRWEDQDFISILGAVSARFMKQDLLVSVTLLD